MEIRVPKFSPNHIEDPAWMQEYLLPITAVEPDRIGEILGRGNEYIVRRYYKEPNKPGTTSGYVLKIPQVDGREESKHWLDPAQLYNEYKMLQKYFGEDTVLETHIVGSRKDEPSHCLIQKEVISPMPLTKELLLANENLCSQFVEIILNNHVIYSKTGYYLPLLGRDGAIGTLEGKPKLTNIMVEGEDTRLYIGDLGRLTHNPLTHLSEIQETREHYPSGNISEVHHLFEKWLEDPAHALVASFRDALSMAGNEAVLRTQFIDSLNHYLQKGPILSK